MMQSLSVVTLGVADLSRSGRFYGEGFGWTPVFANESIVFHQMNGLVLGTFLRDALAEDMGLAGPFAAGPAPITVAHNVRTEREVQAVVDALLAAGGTLLRAPDAPPHGGLRGYVADPDGHAWEIAWMPSFAIAGDGRVTFGV